MMCSNGSEAFDWSCCLCYGSKLNIHKLFAAAAALFPPKAPSKRLGSSQVELLIELFDLRRPEARN